MFEDLQDQGGIIVKTKVSVKKKQIHYLTDVFPITLYSLPTRIL